MILWKCSFGIDFGRFLLSDLHHTFIVCLHLCQKIVVETRLSVLTSQGCLQPVAAARLKFVVFHGEYFWQTHFMTRRKWYCHILPKNAKFIPISVNILISIFKVEDHLCFHFRLYRLIKIYIFSSHKAAEVDKNS